MANWPLWIMAVILVKYYYKFHNIYSKHEFHYRSLIKYNKIYSVYKYYIYIYMIQYTTYINYIKGNLWRLHVIGGENGYFFKVY